MFWRMAEGILAAVEKDPAWPDQRRSISANNDELRKLLHRVDRRSCAATTRSCSRRSTPNYPPGGKRMLLDNGNWIRRCAATTCELVTDRDPRDQRDAASSRRAASSTTPTC